MLISNLFVVGASLLTFTAARPAPVSPGVIFDAVEKRWGQKWIRSEPCTVSEAKAAGCINTCVRYAHSGPVCYEKQDASDLKL